MEQDQISDLVTIGLDDQIKGYENAIARATLSKGALTFMYRLLIQLLQDTVPARAGQIHGDIQKLQTIKPTAPDLESEASKFEFPSCARLVPEDMQRAVLLTGWSIFRRADKTRLQLKNDFRNLIAGSVAVDGEATSSTATTASPSYRLGGKEEEGEEGDADGEEEEEMVKRNKKPRYSQKNNKNCNNPSSSSAPSIFPKRKRV